MSLGAPPPAPGGLKSTLKIAVPIIALMGVIFGVTFFAQYTQKPQDEGDKPGQSGPNRNEPPLVFFSSARSWNPPDLTAPGYRNMPLLAPAAIPTDPDRPFEFSLQDRVFAGFYEPGPEVRRAAFWFENRNPNPVTMQLKGVNCGACSGGRLAPIPPALTKAYLHRTALAALPIGPFNAFGVGLADPAAEFSKLEWTNYKFQDNPNATYHVPAAPSPPDKWGPQWGILELTFTVNKDPKVPLESTFATQVDGTSQTGAQKFSIFFAPSEACVVTRPLIDAGEVNQLTGDREYTFMVLSATRGPGSEFGDLEKPVCDVQAPLGVEKGNFVEVTKIERVPEAELFDVVLEAARGGRMTKVAAAYRVTVVLRPKVGESRLDIGAFERTVVLTIGNATPAVKITAMVRGSVWLATGKTDIEIPTFKGRTGTIHTPELVAESAATELRVVESECKPKFFKYQLVRKPERGGQGYYDLSITVPERRQYGAIDRDAVVVLEVAPPKPPVAMEAANAANAMVSQMLGVPMAQPVPQRIRIPVKGSGEQG